MKIAVTVLAILLLASWGCTPSAQAKAKTAADVAAYNLELNHCEEVGRATKSYEEYEKCAQAADVKFGRKP